MHTTYAQYEEGSWDQWETTLTGLHSRTFVEDRNAFLPSPEEIEERKMMLRWLQSQRFGQHFIGCVMQLDHPGYRLVRKLVSKHGVREAVQRLEPFMPDTDRRFVKAVSIKNR
ncbi:hypothetical protein [Roseimaritima ulvae]|uniref:Uncharacterized protein n=1 Tax=Roseimaritima ulvae TaxID=980254 RepID=A0A5B9QJV8_9BACT|nr:hypothetical protein [Roseimaritima ulvae]QEG39397.1 hypothetical protein UC8_13740 [Roseimaritima ulvae]